MKSSKVVLAALGFTQLIAACGAPEQQSELATAAQVESQKSEEEELLSLSLPIPNQGLFVVQSTTSVELGDVAYMTVYPRPPVVKCVLSKGMQLTNVEGSFGGQFSANVKHAKGHIISKSSCQDGQKVLISTSSKFSGLAKPIKNASLAKVDPSVSSQCELYSNRSSRSLKIISNGSLKGQFIGKVVQTSRREDAMFRKNECAVGELLLVSTQELSELLREKPIVLPPMPCPVWANNAEQGEAPSAETAKIILPGYPSCPAPLPPVHSEPGTVSIDVKPTPSPVAIPAAPAESAAATNESIAQAK